ncbi:MAG: DUF6088 family protein [Clostridiales Family XIII bacterium]|jgi:hypothetical protein|nr:DUF6088 family protein [Clostridiales Family XIII bacterium]
MTFSEYLKGYYGVGEPIYVAEIAFKNYSRPWIFKELKKLVESGEIKRFDTGIYYFPRKMPYGDAHLDPRKVVQRRFLSNGNEVYGYVTGISLLNMAGLTTQVPNLLELVTNNETTRVRDIRVGHQRIRARRSRTTVTKNNVNALQFLDLMNIITPKNLDETERHMLQKYIRSSGVTRDSVVQYAGYFPARAMKNMIESGAAYDLT